MGADYMNRCAGFGERARFAQVTFIPVFHVSGLTGLSRNNKAISFAFLTC